MVQGSRRRRVTGPRIIAGLGIALLIAFLVGAWAVLRTPGWYAPPVIPPSERQQVRNSLVSVEQDFTERLRTGSEPFTFSLRQDVVNRWLTMRREIYPAVDELLPEEVSDPFIAFSEGRITLAARVTTAAGRVVVSVDVHPSFKDDAIVLRLGAIRCGSMPAPIDAADLGLSGEIDRDTDDAWEGSPPMRGDLINGLRIEPLARWFNGGFGYRVLDVRAEPGLLTFRIQPLGHRGG